MRLYLVQHGRPVAKEINPDRPLSDEGRAEVERIASFIKRSGLEVRKILHSGKTRAKDTAEILASALGIDIEQREGLAPLDDVEPLAKELDESFDNNMLVGHLPHLDRLASLLVAGDQEAGIVRFTQGGVVCLDKAEDEHHWRVAWAVIPQIIT